MNEETNKLIINILIGSILIVQALSFIAREINERKRKKYDEQILKNIIKNQNKQGN